MRDFVIGLFLWRFVMDNLRWIVGLLFAVFSAANVIIPASELIAWADQYSDLINDLSKSMVMIIITCFLKCYLLHSGGGWLFSRNLCTFWKSNSAVNLLGSLFYGTILGFYLGYFNEMRSRESQYLSQRLSEALIGRFTLEMASEFSDSSGDIASSGYKPWLFGFDVLRWIIQATIGN